MTNPSISVHELCKSWKAYNPYKGVTRTGKKMYDDQSWRQLQMWVLKDAFMNARA